MARTLVLFVACGWASCTDDPAVEDDAGELTDPVTTEPDAADIDSGGDSEPDAAPVLEEDAGPEADAGPTACKEAADCAADEFCHEDGDCRKTIPPECAACTPEHPCDLENRRCDCSAHDGDADGDGFPASVCGGKDCNDADPDVSPIGTEICDFTDPASLDTDEDCDPSTLAYKSDDDRAFRGVTVSDRQRNGDADGDGWVSDRCTNRVSADEVHTGSDCKDNDPNVHKHQTEACNGYDDNCNDLTDELADQDAGVDQPAQYIDGGLLLPYYPDRDEDNYGAIGATPVYFCPNVLPRFMVSREGEPSDPDDTNRNVHPGAREICDGVNNETGVKGDDLTTVEFDYQIPQTTFACVNGKVEISACPPTDVLWCGTPVADGCITDATALKSCHACVTDCKFGCGTKACDTLSDLRLGDEFTCAQGTEGRVACWGNPGKGRLGHQTTNRASVPMWLPRISGARALALGSLHACAITGDERNVWCWGANASGQLGTLESGDSAAPLQVRVTGDLPLAGTDSIAAGSAHTCAVVQGVVKCWGSTADGRLGNRVTATTLSIGFVDALRGTKRILDASAVGVGLRHTCILSRGLGAECWGNNSLGQLGLGNTDVATAGAHTVLGLPDAPSALAVGGDHACTLHAGKVYCWGSNAFGQLGPRAVDAPANVASQVLGLEDARAIVAGAGVTCALRTAGAPVCWGANTFGQLGVATSQVTLGTLVPLVVSGLAEISQLRIGEKHACAIAADGTSTCWGWNGYAELGSGRAALGADLSFTPIIAVQGQGS